MGLRNTIIAAFIATPVFGAFASCTPSDPADGAGGGKPVTTSGSGSYVPPDETEVDCSTDAHCAVNGPCAVGRCVESRCTVEPIPDGPAPGIEDDPSDCLDARCVGGRVQGVTDDSEAPPDDEACIVVTCELDGPVTRNAPAGTPCPAGECDDVGRCTGCVDPVDCGGKDSFCRTRTCVDSICGYEVAEAGTRLPDNEQKAGDCSQKVCDGDGKVTDEPDESDLEEDNDDDPCTQSACATEGARSRLVEPGTECGGGNVCDSQGECVECYDDSQCEPPEVCGGTTKGKCGCDADSHLISCFQRCGTITNNCGQEEQCGTCSQGKVCFETECCTRDSQTEVCQGVECGTVVDNCGMDVDCGDPCVAPETCGGGGTANVCGCTENGAECAGKNCGSAVTNCGRPVTCAPDACPALQTCGGGGEANVCGCTDDGTNWCAGRNCGTVTNNCGTAVTCTPNSCNAPQTCGGGGTPNVCGCTDDGAACQGKECGTAISNCGQEIVCPPNNCPGGTLCGVPTANQCGTQ